MEGRGSQRPTGACPTGGPADPRNRSPHSSHPPESYCCRSILVMSKVVKGANSPQTFHKRSTNVPISNRNEIKTLGFFTEFVLSKEIISIWSRRLKSKNDIGTFVLTFLTSLEYCCRRSEQDFPASYFENFGG